MKTLPEHVVHYKSTPEFTQDSVPAGLLRAHTTFVCIELSTGKPKRMPAEFLDGYGPALTGG